MTLLCAGLMLIGLDEHRFWGDEAITAFYARSVVRHGLPYGFDHQDEIRNLCAYGGGTSLNRNLVATAYPWLQFYVAAASLAIFEDPTFAGRLPFALIGVAVVALTYLAARKFGQARGASLFACLLLACSPQYLLFMRQCRYFAPAALFSLLMLLQFPKVELKKPRSWLIFAVLSILLFYSHFLVLIVFYLGLAITFCLFERDWRRFTAFLLATVVTLAATLPWLLLFPDASGQSGIVGEKGLGRAAWLFWLYVRDLNRACFFPAAVLLILPLAIVDGRRRGRQSGAGGRGSGVGGRGAHGHALFLLVLVLMNVVLLCLVSPQESRTVRAGPAGEAGLGVLSTHADLRFAVHLMPIMAILMGAAAWAVWRRRRVLGGAVIAVLLFTNFATFTGPRFYLYEYVHEFTRGYRTSTDGICRHLGKHVAQDEVVLIEPAYRRDPFIFYLGDKLLFCGILPPDEDRILPMQRGRLPRHVYSGDLAPDWIITFKSRQRLLEEKLALSGPIWDYIDRRGVAYDIYAVEDLYWMDTSRPELTCHEFRALIPIDPEERVFIYQRRKSRHITGSTK